MIKQKVSSLSKLGLIIAVLVVLVVALNGVRFTRAACTLIEEGYGTPGQHPVHLEKVVTGLVVPWSIGFLPDGDFLVTERPGRVRIVRNSQLDPKSVLEIATSEPGEGGLLGIAIDPKFSSNRYFYVYYTLNKGSGNVNRVVRYRLSEEKNSATQIKVIIDDIPAAVRHNGGRIHFGPDGYLYIGTGDAARPERSQDLNSPAGKILRLTSDGDIPGDNPWPGNPAFIIGVRNVQGFDWINQDTLSVVDHGPSGELGRYGHDELTLAKKGANLGWPTVWQCQERVGFIPPVLVWQEALPPGGIALYKSSQISGWEGGLLITSLGAEQLQRVVLKSPGLDQVLVNEVYFQTGSSENHGRLREIIQSPRGDVFITTSNCDGRGSCPPEKDMILRIVSQ